MKLKDLADTLGLSQTTVSRALNGYPEVNEETRSRVLEAAHRHHYRPNASARRLATGRVGAVGAVLHTNRSQLIDPHYVEFLAGGGERLAEDEIDIVLSPTKSEAEGAFAQGFAQQFGNIGLIVTAVLSAVFEEAFASTSCSSSCTRSVTSSMMMMLPTVVAAPKCTPGTRSGHVATFTRRRRCATADQPQLIGGDLEA